MLFSPSFWWMLYTLHRSQLHGQLPQKRANFLFRLTTVGVWLRARAIWRRSPSKLEKIPELQDLKDLRPAEDLSAHQSF
eukprot:s291_g26.t1